MLAYSSTSVKVLVMSSPDKLTYEKAGVDYLALDPFKIMAQRAAFSTRFNLQKFGYEELEESRGESAYIWDAGDKYFAFVTEGLGTKNLIADDSREISGKTNYEVIGQDTIAMIVNDLIVVGARPLVVSAHMSVQNAKWFSDQERNQDLISGWVKACNLAGATWGGGETPALKGIIEPGVIELSGSAVGEIVPKEHLIIGDKLRPKDVIIFLGSSGIHANGATLAREIKEILPDGYSTKIDEDGISYGEALLQPTPIYVRAVQDLLEQEIDVHYLANITGHGWRKIMRADRKFSYVISDIPEPLPIFNFIQKHSKNNNEQMYSNFNMGAGFAVFVNPTDAELAYDILQDYNPFIAGTVEKGPKQVIIEPLNITFTEETLNIRK